MRERTLRYQTIVELELVTLGLIRQPARQPGFSGPRSVGTAFAESSG
jgi:hypothetical protein